MLRWGLIAFWVTFRQFSSRQMRISTFYVCPIFVLEILNHWNNVLTVENLPYLSGKAERNIAK